MNAAWLFVVVVFICFVVKEESGVDDIWMFCSVECG